MNMGILLPVMVFISFLLVTPVMAFAVKQKSQKAFKFMFISGAVFAVLGMVLMIFAIIFKGEPLIVFAVSCMALLMLHLLATFKILDIAAHPK